MEKVRRFTTIKGPIEYTTVANRTFLPQSICPQTLFVYLFKFQKYGNSCEELQLKKTKFPNAK